MKYLKILLAKIVKAYKEIVFLRWVTLAVVFVLVEVSILLPLFSSRKQTDDDSLSVSSEKRTESVWTASEDDASSLSIVETSSSNESSSAIVSSEKESSESSEESSVEEESSESSEESSVEEESSDSSEESSLEEESSESSEESSVEEESSDSSEESSVEEESSDSVEESSVEEESSESSEESSVEGDSSDSVEEDSSETGGEETLEGSLVGEKENTVTYTLSYKSDRYAEYYICTGLAENSKKNPTSIVIPDTYDGMEVREIEESAFSNLYSLHSVTIGRNVEEVGENAFYGCFNLLEAYILCDLDVTDCGLSHVKTVFTDLSERSKIRYFGDWAVYADGNDLLIIGYHGSDEVVTTPNTATKINAYAFAKSGVKSVTLSNTITTLASRAFAECETLTEVVLGNGVRCIEIYAFEETLQTLIFPSAIRNGWTLGKDTPLTAEETKRLEDPTSAAIFYFEKRDCTWYRE